MGTARDQTGRWTAEGGGAGGYRGGTLWASPESRLRLPDGKVWTVPVPWAEKGSRFTRLFERLAAKVLLAARSLQQSASWRRLDWDAVQRIMERDVKQARHVCADFIGAGVGGADPGRQGTPAHARLFAVKESLSFRPLAETSASTRARPGRRSGGRGISATATVM